MMKRYQLLVRDNETGEERVMWITHPMLKVLTRAIRRYTAAPQYLADFFTFPPRRGPVQRELVSQPGNGSRNIGTPPAPRQEGEAWRQAL